MAQRETRADDDPVRFETVFSSEAAEVERVFEIDGELVRCLEVLDHSEASVDLSFFRTGRAPLLVDHKRESQVGVLEGARIQGRNGIAEGRFSRSERARDEVLDVTDGIRRNVSVGYDILEIQLEERRGGRPIARVTKWAPLEVSILSVPADQGATIAARADEAFTIDTVVRRTRGKTMDEETTTTTTTTATEERSHQPGEARRTVPLEPSELDAEDITRRERARVKAIRALGAKHQRGDLADAAIDKGLALETFKGILLDTIADGVPLEDPAGKLGLSKRERKRYSFLRALEVLSTPAQGRQWKDVQKRCGFELECSSGVFGNLSNDERIRRSKRGADETSVFVPADALETGFSSEDIERMLLRNTPEALGLGHLRGWAAAREERRGMQEMMRTHSVGTAGLGGNLVGTDHLGGSFIEVLYNSMMVRNLGARVLSGLVGNVQIPRRTAGGSTRWTAELVAAVTGGDLDIGDSTFDQVTLAPHDLTSTSLMSRRLILQSDPSIEALVRSDLAVAIALAVDSAAINGDSATDANQPDGILNIAGVNETSFGAPDGGALTYANAITMIADVMRSNALNGGVGGAWLMNATGWERGMTVERATGTAKFVIDEGQFAGRPFAVSEQVPGNLVEGASGATLSGLIFAAWSQMLIGEWGVLEMQIDPYTAVAAGAVRVNAFFTTDIALRHEDAFSRSVDMT